MEIKKGTGVSPGVVISTAIVLDADDLVIPKRRVEPEETPGEIDRLREAIHSGVEDLTTLRTAVAAKHGKEIGGIFDFHLGILRDRSIVQQIVKEIKDNNSTAEYAVSTVMRRYAASFLAMSDRYLSERVKDIYDIEHRVLKVLVGQKHEDLGHLSRDVVVI